MTLSQLYEKIKLQPKAERPLTPAASFVKEVAEVTCKSELAVRRWLSGAALPDTLTQRVLADHFKTTPEELFPKK